ncbi:MAG: hypothetical protein PHF00_01665 [Elusimicrobia bacterium]|nr:hypothetical protein [Elusimicrobiota bacterium]
MADIQLALLLGALGLLGWYVFGSLARESSRGGEFRRQEGHQPARLGLRWFAWGLALNLALSVPLLAPNPFSIDEGHSLGAWLAAFLSPWLRWVGLTQLAYLIPLWLRLRATGRPAAARTLALAGGITLSASALAWSLRLWRLEGPSAQAAGGLLGLSAAVALLWLAPRLRRLAR